MTMNDPLSLRILPADELGEPLTCLVNGRPLTAYSGETILTVLLAAGHRTLRHLDGTHSPRGAFCNQGVCFECLVTVDGVPNVQACMTRVRDGMNIVTGDPDA